MFLRETDEASPAFAILRGRVGEDLMLGGHVSKMASERCCALHPF